MTKTCLHELGPQQDAIAGLHIGSGSSVEQGASHIVVLAADTADVRQCFADLVAVGAQTGHALTLGKLDAASCRHGRQNDSAGVRDVVCRVLASIKSIIICAHLCPLGSLLFC